MILATPPLTPVTEPTPETNATAGLLLLQVPMPVSTNEIVPNWHTVGEPEIPVGNGLMVTLNVAGAPQAVEAVMVTVPAEIPVTIPVELTVATPAVPPDHTAPRALSESVSVDPAHTALSPVMALAEVLTVTAKEAAVPQPEENTMVSTPDETPDTKPEVASTVATDVLVLDQVPLEPPSDNANVPVEQRLEPPVIGAGAPFTDTVSVALPHEVV